MGRPRGRRYQQYKIYLNPKQIKWLQSLPYFNVSKLFRRLLDDHMHSKLGELITRLEHYHKRLEELNAELKQRKATWKEGEAPPKTLDLIENIDAVEGQIVQITYETEKLKECLESRRE